ILLSGIATKKSKIMALDVGCGIGRNVAFLRTQGINVIGIDSSEYAAKTSKQIRASGIQIPIRSGSVDLVAAIHFVEHLAPDNMVRFLSECNRILKHDGVLFVVTPNAISPMRFFLRKRFFFDPSHAVFWNPVALGRLL